MCLICVEYYYQRMTKAEVAKALPEMVLFAKTEEERNHFKKLQSFDSEEEMKKEAETYVASNGDKAQNANDYKVSSKSRRL